MGVCSWWIRKDSCWEDLGRAEACGPGARALGLTILKEASEILAPPKRLGSIRVPSGGDSPRALVWVRSEPFDDSAIRGDTVAGSSRDRKSLVLSRSRQTVARRIPNTLRTGNSRCFAIARPLKPRARSRFTTSRLIVCGRPSLTPCFLAKLQGNAARDRRNVRDLRVLGWRPIVIWECELERIEKLRRRIARLFNEAGPCDASKKRKGHLQSSSGAMRIRSQRADSPEPVVEASEVIVILLSDGLPGRLIMLCIAQI